MIVGPQRHQQPQDAALWNGVHTGLRTPRNEPRIVRGAVSPTTSCAIIGRSDVHGRGDAIASRKSNIGHGMLRRLEPVTFQASAPLLGHECRRIEAGRRVIPSPSPLPGQCA